MNHISSLFGDTRKKIIVPSMRRNTERGDLMQYFLSQLNPRRLAAGFKPYTYPRLGGMLEGIPTKDLYYIRSRCDDSTNWSATFHYLLNPDKYDKKQVHPARSQ